MSSYAKVVLVSILVVSAAVGCGLYIQKSWKKPASRMGIVMCDTHTKRWLKDGFHLRREFESAGFKVDLVFCDTVEEQQKAVEKLLAEKPTLLVIAPIDGRKFSDALSKADSTCRVIAYDRMIFDAPEVSACVTFDSAEVGRLMARSVVEAIAPAPGKKRSVALVGGALTDGNVSEIHRGVLSVFQPLIDRGEIVITDGNTELRKVAAEQWSSRLAKKRMLSLLDRFPVPDAVVAYSDTMAHGVIDALTEKKIPPEKFPFITGQDGDNRTLKDIPAGRQHFSVYKDTSALAGRTLAVAAALRNRKKPRPDAFANNDGRKIPVFYSKLQPISRGNCAGIAARISGKPFYLPEGFTYVSDAVADAVIDLRYASPDNFTGQVVPGYAAPRPSLTREAAAALVRAADFLRGSGYRIVVYDAYRPKKAVEGFVRWAESPAEGKKQKYFPHLSKRQLLEGGYISAESAHSRGSTVDLGLCDSKGNPLDMGGEFDLFDPVSHHDAAVGPEQKKRREALRSAMERAGFLSIPNEWWHYRLAKEPFPESSFNFDVR